MQEGGSLETHDDVPEHIRRELRDEEQQEQRRKRKRSESPVRGLPPINIHVSSSPRSANQECASNTDATVPLCHKCSSRLVIPGLREDVVHSYTDWQCSRVREGYLKSELRKAGGITLGDGLSLEQVHRDQDSSIYTAHGVKRGIARSFVEDIATWVEEGMPTE